MLATPLPIESSTWSVAPGSPAAMPRGACVTRGVGALVPYETPWVDLSAREVEEDEWGPVIAVVGIVAVVVVVAMVTDTHLESSVHVGPVGWDVEVN